MQSKVKILLFFALFIFLLLPVVADAQRPLEVEYPPAPGISERPTSADTDIPVYVKYIFNFSLWITGFIALGALFYGGFRYLTSVGSPTALTDARNQILAALTGLLILASSWLILTAINPELIELKIKPAPRVLASLYPGVYLCLEKTDEVRLAWDLIQEIERMDIDDPKRTEKIKQLNEYLEKISDKCWLVPTETGKLPNKKFDDKVKWVYLVPTETGRYGVILYENSKFSGKTEVAMHGLAPVVAWYEIRQIKPSSVRPFILKEPREGVFVEIYELIDHNKAGPTKKSQRYDRSEITGLTSHNIPLAQFEKVGSVKIEGDLFVVFLKDVQPIKYWMPGSEIDVILKTDENLYDNLMGSWCWEWSWSLWSYYPCPKQMVIVSGGIY